MVRLPGGGIFELSTWDRNIRGKASRGIRCTKAQKKGSLGTERHLPGRTVFQKTAQNQAGLVQILALPILIQDLGPCLRVLICKMRIIMLLPWLLRELQI